MLIAAAIAGFSVAGANAQMGYGTAGTVSASSSE